MSDQFFYMFSAILLGLVIGALIMYFSSGSNRDSDKTIAKLEKKLNAYQQDVAEHFEETANLVDDMTQSYKKVFDHMGKSARLLMTDEQIQEQIEKRKGNKVTLEFLTEEPGSSDLDDDSEIYHVAEEIENTELIDDADSDLEKDELVEKNEAEEVLGEEYPESDVLEDKEEDLEQEVEQREKNIYT